MTNTEILAQLELTAQLLELHAENEFKIKAFQSAIYQLDKITEDLGILSSEALTKLAGKSMATKIEEIYSKGVLTELSELLDRTPDSVIELFEVKGIGPKKVRQIWLDAGIDNPNDLMIACQNGEIAKLKGFGEKLQEKIIESLEFKQSNTNKLRLDKAENLAQSIVELLEKYSDKVEISGQLRRTCEVIDVIEILVAANDFGAIQQHIQSIDFLVQDNKSSSPFVWRGKALNQNIPIEILYTNNEEFGNQLFIHSSAEKHLIQKGSTGLSLWQIAQTENTANEDSIYLKAGLPYIVPEMREGLHEFEWAKKYSPEQLVTWNSLKGVLHNHSTYSDGKHSLSEMATYCRDLGFDYFGIADHSQTAIYAKGLKIFQVEQQQAEIKQLNQELAPFCVLSGIESDILGDGSLDYPDEILKTFDYVVASVHQNLSMDEDKAMTRLLKAIENPYTTILGHPTGRLLLSRKGYPINHKKIIDACATNGVIMELNASPYRLDIDWRWIYYCMEKGVKVSINPDAHTKDGFFDMHYGVAVARKGGLTSEFTFNTLNIAEMKNFLAK